MMLVESVYVWDLVISMYYEIFVELDFSEDPCLREPGYPLSCNEYRYLYIFPMTGSTTAPKR